MTKKNNDHKDNDDSELFRKAVEGTRPLHYDKLSSDKICSDKISSHKLDTNKSNPSKKITSKISALKKHFNQSTKPSENSTTYQYSPQDISPGDILVYCAPGIQKKLFRKLRKGQLAIEANLDLHGLYKTNAHAQLNLFLDECSSANYRCIIIIHGKGKGSLDQKPVLKTAVNEWLRNDSRVLAFCSALQKHGGSGAVYVLLKKEHQ